MACQICSVNPIDAKRFDNMLNHKLQLNFLVCTQCRDNTLNYSIFFSSVLYKLIHLTTNKIENKFYKRNSTLNLLI